MSNKQRKAPEIEYRLKANLQKLDDRRTQLEKQFEILPTIEAVRELSILNYHIECLTNRIDGVFIDPQGDCEYAVNQTHITYTGN